MVKVIFFPQWHTSHPSSFYEDNCNNVLITKKKFIFFSVVSSSFYGRVLRLYYLDYFIFVGTLLLKFTVDPIIHQFLQLIYSFLFIRCWDLLSGHKCLVSCVEGWLYRSVPIPVSFDLKCQVWALFLFLHYNFA